MKQVLLKSGRVVVEEVPAPSCQDNTILIANHYSLISSGTEGSLIQSEAANLLDKIRTQPELLKKGFQSLKEKGIASTLEEVKKEQSKVISLGYSCAGEVLEVGSQVSGFSPGDRVACAGTGWANHSEIINVPEKLCLKLPPGLALEAAAFTTIGSIALQGLRRTRVSLGENIVVLGLGLIGLITVQLVKAAGGRVLAIDLDPKRCDLAKELGADQALTLDSVGAGLVPAKAGIVPALKIGAEFSSGMGADAVIICAATPGNQPVELALQLVRKKGRIVVVGTVGMNIPRSPFYEKELDFLISCSYGPGRYDPAYELQGQDYPLPYVRWTEKRNMQEFALLLAEGRVQVKPLISQVTPFEQAPSAYQKLQAAGSKPLAVLLRYQPEAAQTGTPHLELRPRRLAKGTLQVGLIGCGQFAQNIHLPILKSLPQYQLAALAGRNPVKLKEAATKFGAAYCTTDYREILADKAIDLVVITTRHNLHAPLVIEAARAGKDVFVEKPLAMSKEELAEVVCVLGETGRCCWVGFNRRYAPFTLKAKELLGAQPGPILINYRINAGFLPLEHWTQDPQEGGGRIIGEVCHFVDWINYLVDDELVGVQAAAIPPNGASVVAEDNLVATLRYRCGSLGIITYTSLGEEKLPKERIEIYAGGRVMVIEDFRRMHFYGFPCPDSSLKTQDKGFRNQWQSIARSILGKSEVSFELEQAINSTRITLQILDCLRTGQHS